MKQYLAAVALCAGVQIAFAQATPARTQAPAQAKPAATVKPTSRAGLSRSAQKAVEEATPVDDDPHIVLSDADVEVARKVYVGEMKCELGASVRVRPGRREGIFMVTTRNLRFLMHPVESRTGAIRLEDPRRGAMWLQLGNKSMLMSQKLGQRLADECQSPEQVTAAEVMRRNPPRSLLEGLPGVTPAPSDAPAAAPADSVAPSAPSAPTAPPAADAPAADAPAAGTPTASTP